MTSSPSRRELSVVAACIGSLLALPLLVPALRALYTRPLWLDELHTWLLARDLPGPALVHRLSQGADFNPPLLYVIDSLVLRLLPFVPAQVALRLTSVLAVWLALVLLYRICRDGLSPIPSAVAVAVALASSVLLGQLHEARFYAPWLLLAVAVARAMQDVAEHPRSRASFARLAVLTAATCLIHYFGVISLACLSLGFVARERSPTLLRRLASAMALGGLALVAWMPVYLAQRHVLSVSTWIAPPTASSALQFLLLFVGWQSFAAVAIAGAAYALLVGRATPDRAVPPSIAQSALIGLLALPLALVAFSFLVQPSLLGRYALPAVAGLACVVAIATARLPRAIQIVVLILAVGVHARSIVRKAWGADGFARGVNDSVAAVNLAADDPRPVLSLERFALYPVALSPANRNTHVAFLTLPSDTIRAHLAGRVDSSAAANFAIVERDAAVAHGRALGFPALLSLDAMRRASGFFLLVTDGRNAPPFAELFGGFTACRVDPHLLLLTASPGRNETGATMVNSAPCERVAPTPAPAPTPTPAPAR